MKFTGERVIYRPQAPVDLNYLRHLAAYEYASRFVTGGKILEVGCGSGYGIAQLAQQNSALYFAVDRQPETIHYARKFDQQRRIGFAVSDGCFLTFPDRTFDRVFCFQVLEHVQDQAKFVQELLRVSRPGGMLMLTTPNRVTYAAENNYVPNPFHVHEFDLAELIEFFMDFGRDLEIKGIRKSPRLEQTEQAIAVSRNRPLARRIRRLGLASLAPLTPVWLKRLIVSETKTDYLQRTGIDASDFFVTDTVDAAVLDFLVAVHC